jgi:hypothetical protein
MAGRRCKAEAYYQQIYYVKKDMFSVSLLEPLKMFGSIWKIHPGKVVNQIISLILGKVSLG